MNLSDLELNGNRVFPRYDFWLLFTNAGNSIYWLYQSALQKEYTPWLNVGDKKKLDIKDGLHDRPQKI